MSSRPDHPLQNAEQLVEDATRLLFVGDLREMRATCDEKLLQQGLDWCELRDAIVRHRDAPDWFQRSVNDFAPLFDGDQALVQKMLQFSMIEQTGIHLYNLLYRTSELGKEPVDQAQHRELRDGIMRNRQTLKNMVEKFGDVDSALARFVTDEFIGNLRQQLGLEEFLGR